MSEQSDARIAVVAERFSGTLSFAAKNLRTGEEMLFRADEVLPTASLVKLAILLEVFRQAEAASISLDSRVELRDTDIVGGSGVLRAMSPGTALAIRDLALLMVAVSDNVATNILLEQVGGPAAVNEAMDRLGLATIRLHSRVDFDHIGDDIRRFAEGSARDFRDLMEMIVRERVVGPDASRQMIAILQKQVHLDQVPRYLHFNPYAEDESAAGGMSVAAKTGFYPGTRTDAGAVFMAAGTTIVYCAMTAAGSDGSLSPENEGAVVAGVLGRLMVERWWPPDLGAPPIVESPHFELLVDSPRGP